jgi:hypothetical protein
MADDKAQWSHTLALHFGRVLDESEWREVVEQARTLPYVQQLEARAEPTQQPTDSTQLDGRLRVQAQVLEEMHYILDGRHARTGNLIETAALLREAATEIGRLNAALQARDLPTAGERFRDRNS